MRMDATLLGMRLLFKRGTLFLAAMIALAGLLCVASGCASRDTAGPESGESSEAAYAPLCRFEYHGGDDDGYSVQGFSEASVATSGLTISNGILVSPDTVVTAAHSLTNFRARGYTVEVFPSPTAVPVQREVDKICVSESYEEGRRPEDDVAIIKLVDPVGEADGLTGGYSYSPSGLASGTSMPSLTLRGYVYRDSVDVQYFSENVERVVIEGSTLEYSAWSERGVSGAPLVDSEGGAIGMHIQALGDRGRKRGVILRKGLIDVIRSGAYQ